MFPKCCAARTDPQVGLGHKSGPRQIGHKSAGRIRAPQIVNIPPFLLVFLSADTKYRVFKCFSNGMLLSSSTAELGSRPIKKKICGEWVALVAFCAEIAATTRFASLRLRNAFSFVPTNHSIPFRFLETSKVAFTLL
jgi:hypothetical protein